MATGVRAALKKGKPFNPVITEEGEHCYIIVPTADKGLKKQYLGRSLEQHRFALGCDCEGGHCFYETLHNFTHRPDRLCKYCSLATGMWDAANKKKVSEPEISLQLATKELGIDTQVACEVNLAWWHGRLDYYHMPSKTAMQVDGSGHFKDTYHMQEGHQLQLDLKCCRAAWMACGRLLRVHHESGLMCRVVMAAVCMPHARFVMVSRQYTSVAVTWAGISKSYTDWLLSVLVGCKCYFHSATDCIIYC